MNNQLESTGNSYVSTEKINGHATAVAGNMSHADWPGIFRGDGGEVADRNTRWQRHQKLNTENDRSMEFLVVFSHELRTSLSAIRGATGILRVEQSIGPAGMKARVLIERQVGQMVRLVEDLLDMSRVRSGQLRLQRERIDLRAVAARAVQTVEFAMEQRNHRMTTLFPDAPVWLQADPIRLEQVFVNLLLNAAKYTDAGGYIALSVEREEAQVAVRIRDSGIGITSDVLPHVFNLFVQADPSSPRVDAGLGIGLALVRSLVECHGGTVTAASAGLRRGSEFTVRLPLPTAPANAQ